MALMTRARVDVLTTLALLSTRDTVAVDTFARRATCSKFMSFTLYRDVDSDYMGRKRGAGFRYAGTLKSRPVSNNGIRHVYETENGSNGHGGDRSRRVRNRACLRASL